MKNIIKLLIVILIASILFLYFTRPNIPITNGSIDHSKGANCFQNIVKLYKPQLLTYQASSKFWFAQKLDKLGVTMNDDLLMFYRDYLSLRREVNCFIRLSNDDSLNMNQGASVFKAMHNSISEFQNLPIIR